ncbi:MAG: alpha/beta hydrolase [Candidatus Thorarchaeota archaeon]
MAPNVKGDTTRSEGATVAFLLVHGFCASSDELATLGRYLSDAGYSSFAVQLAGHGTTPEELKATSWQDWYESARSGLEVVRSWNPKFLFVIGFSMGGALSTLLASEESDIDGLVLIAPALKISGFLPKLVPILKFFIKYREIDVEEVQRVYDVKRTKYDREPVSAYSELFKLQKAVRKNMNKVVVPTLVLQGIDDRTIDPSNGQIAFDSISSEKKELHMIEGAEHVISCHPTRVDAYPHILAFVEEIVS